MNNYVIITPAHNEEAHLERTVRAVLAQTLKPLRWVIVNDGSSDRTQAIAEQFASETSFIKVISVDRVGAHGFNKKAEAFNAGVASLAGLTYEFIGNLDADITVGADYFEKLLRAFAQDRRLGITGGMIYTKVREKFVTYDETPDSVAGAVQFFRQECFADVGAGYLPLPYGGIDAAAEIMAKSRGWRVRKSFQDKAYEHRQTGTATKSPLAAAYRLGRRFHSLGYGLLFYSLRCLYRIGNDPVLFGSLAAFLGFAESLVRRRPVKLPPEVVAYLRREQRKKLRLLLAPRASGAPEPA